MNKEYVYSNGKVLVRDEIDNTKIMNYSDNIDEVLVQENIIEELEKRKQKLEKNMRYFVKKPSITKSFLSAIMMTLIFLISVFGISRFFGMNEIMTNSVFGLITEETFMLISGASIVLILSSWLFLASYWTQKTEYKTQKGEKVELEFINALLKIEQEKLENLRKIAKEQVMNQPIEDLTVSKVDLGKLKLLRDWLWFYKELGSNEDKYLKYYEKGTLLEKLNKSGFSQSEIDFAKMYIEEENKKLIKTR